MELILIRMITKFINKYTYKLQEDSNKWLIAKVTSSSNLLSKANKILFISLEVGIILDFLIKRILSFLSNLL